MNSGLSQNVPLPVEAVKQSIDKALELLPGSKGEHIIDEKLRLAIDELVSAKTLIDLFVGEAVGVSLDEVVRRLRQGKCVLNGRAMILANYELKGDQAHEYLTLSLIESRNAK